MIKRLGQYLIYGHFYIAFAAAALTAATYRITHGQLRLDATVALVFFATLLIYHLDSLLDPIPINTTHRQQWEQRHRIFRLLTIALSTIATAITLFYIPARMFWFLMPLALISLIYSLPFGLKRVPWCKTFLVAFTWTAVTVGIPWISATTHPFPPIVTSLLWGHRLAFLFALALMFDMRDVQKDQRAGLITLPMSLGRFKTKAVALSALAITMIPACTFGSLSHWRANYPGLALAVPTTSVLTMLLIVRIKPSSSDWFYQVFLDGTIIFYAAMLY